MDSVSLSLFNILRYSGQINDSYNCEYSHNPIDRWYAHNRYNQ